MPERVMRQSQSRLLQWSARLPLIRRACTPQSRKVDRQTADHEAFGFFHALIPALLLSLLLWGLLLLL
ncbi:MAG: hypothetical protein AB7I59_00480 [Geminicoccaceae bacterium]